MVTKVINPTDPMTDSTLNLQTFFPYRLSILYDEISQSVAQVYAKRYQLTRPQWRVLATLGNSEPLSAKVIASQTRLEKMQVSRAVEQLNQKGLIDKQSDESDKRHLRLALTSRGLRLYQEIVPLVLARESFLLSALSAKQQEEFQEMMEQLREKSLELKSYG
ncbi:MAG: MarR family transcriptional regulator [Pseudomonadota bacterium]